MNCWYRSAGALAESRLADLEGVGQVLGCMRVDCCGTGGTWVEVLIGMSVTPEEHPQKHTLSTQDHIDQWINHEVRVPLFTGLLHEPTDRSHVSDWPPEGTEQPSTSSGNPRFISQPTHVWSPERVRASGRSLQRVLEGACVVGRRTCRRRAKGRQVGGHLRQCQAAGLASS